jgi:sugar phosphate permease
LGRVGKRACIGRPLSSPALESPASKAVFVKIDRRLLPLLLIAYMIAYLDRINIGYAQLQMKQTLPFDDAVYGLGAGIFFIGYFLFEVPSNLLLERIGARSGLRIFVRSRMSTRASVSLSRSARASISCTWSFQIVTL